MEHRRLLAAQRNEKTEYLIYQRFAAITRNQHNREILLKLAEKERLHHDAWRVRSGTEVKDNAIKVNLFCLLSRVLGISFAMKLMERAHAGPMAAGRSQFTDLRSSELSAAEDEDEMQLLRLIDEERLNYIGAAILGLNDALVELTGALAGFSFAMHSSRVVAMAGLITGIAAALSMGGTGYLATKADEGGKSPRKFALYTGATYLATVILLVLPYLVLDNVYGALGLTLLIALLIMLAFNFYISVVKEVSFWSKFGEMALLSMGIAAISFGIGVLAREILHVQI